MALFQHHIQRSTSMCATLCDCMSFWYNPFNHLLVSVNITAIHLWDVMWTVNKLVRWGDITKHKTCDLNPLCDILVDNTIVLWLAKWSPSPTLSHTRMAEKRGPVLWLAKRPPTPCHTRVAAKRGPEGRTPVFLGLEGCEKWRTEAKHTSRPLALSEIYAG